MNNKGDLNESNYDKKKEIDIIYKNENYNKNNSKNKGQIIHNNFFNINDNIDKNKKNLRVENQKSVSYLGSSKKNLNNNYCEETDTLEEEEAKKNTFHQNQLKKCSQSDIYLPKKNNINNKNNNDKDINNDITNINKKINISKNIICKDDFYYDLYAEKILDVFKNNYSFDEGYKLSDVKERLINKLEKNLYKEDNINNKSAKLKKKKVRFFEGENRYIQINQEEKVSKFSVYNYLGNRIYFKQCNFNEYLKVLKKKNYKTKSILVNKNIEISNDSEWNNLYDLINKIKNKNKINNNLSSKIKTGRFKIKNIESFKKNGEKISQRNKSKEKDNHKKENNIKKANQSVNKDKIKGSKENKNLEKNNNKESYNRLYNTVKNNNIKRMINKKGIDLSKKNIIPKNNAKIQK